MYNRYFDDWEVKSDFSKEYISLWPNWLGKENYHKLDKVTEFEWSRFNDFIRLLNSKYQCFSALHEEQTLIQVEDIESKLSSYSESMEKDASKFSNFIIPSLNCVITEEWDYTYILWYKCASVIQEIKPLLERVKLCHFS